MRDLVIVPIYNEARSVAKVLCEVRHFAGGADILAIDDGSTDETRVILSAEPGVSILEHASNEGYGRSLIDGFAYAQAGGYDRMATIDCDEQHEPRLIPAFLDALDTEGADVVSASRYVPGLQGGHEPPGDRLRINRTITERVNRTAGWELTDAFCGFKAYSVASVAGLALSEPGYGMPLEFWIRAAAAGLTVVERPIPRIYSDSDRSFGADLDFPDRRLAYYERVIDSALAETRQASA
jgi:glycosyltransferase involved in cell wall biosynthesis